MAKKKYEFSYNYGNGTVTFEVDTDVFTNELALATLTFFTWDYDNEADPVDEVMKKYAMEAFRNDNYWDIKTHFESAEGFGRVDGSIGVLLTEFDGYEWDEDELDVKIMEI